MIAPIIIFNKFDGDSLSEMFREHNIYVSIQTLHHLLCYFDSEGFLLRYEINKIPSQHLSR